MSFSLNVQRSDDEAHLFAAGVLTALAADDLFEQIESLIGKGYAIHLHLQDADFIGLSVTRVLRTAALRAEVADVRFHVYGGGALYRVAGLVGPERWTPLPRLAFEDDSVAV